METTMTDTRKGTVVVDEFLEKHGAVLPAHIIDFALDVRSTIGPPFDVPEGTTGCR